MLAKVVEKLRKTELQNASAHRYAGPGDVECDLCIGKKHKAVKSCLMCLASICEIHLTPHLERPALKNHTLVEACGDLQEKICSQHHQLIEIYCRTDRSLICCSCSVEEHEGHDTVGVKTERSEKQNEVKELQMKSQQRIQEKQKKLQELQHTVTIIKVRAQTAVENNERIFDELIGTLKRESSELIALIRDEEETELRRAGLLLQELEQEINQLKKRVTELEQLSRANDDVRFLQSFESLCVSPGREDSSSITVHQRLSFDGVNKALADLKKRFEEFCQDEFRKIRPCEPTDGVLAEVDQKILPTEPMNRKDLLQYLCELSLDPNTANHHLVLSEENKVVTNSERNQRYPEHPERFGSRFQVLCTDELTGRCYWEVQWSGGVELSVSYKDISRKGRGDECGFGYNSQSWSLCCSSSAPLRFYHSNIETELEAPAPGSTIGVYVDHDEGILTFYSVSDTFTLLHRVRTTFTQPLYAGFWVGWEAAVRLSTPNET